LDVLEALEDELERQGIELRRASETQIIAAWKKVKAGKP